jgi:hypothetical protein
MTWGSHDFDTRLPQEPSSTGCSLLQAAQKLHLPAGTSSPDADARPDGVATTSSPRFRGAPALERAWRAIRGEQAGSDGSARANLN